MNKLLCLFLTLVVVVSVVDAFGVVLSQQSRAAKVQTAGGTAFVPHQHQRCVVLFAKDDDEDEDDPLLDDIVEDDEWMTLVIRLTDTVYGEVKTVIDRLLEEEDIKKKKIEKAGREIEVYVKGEVEKLRMDAKADLAQFTSSLTKTIESEVRETTGKTDFKIDDYTKEAEAQLMAAITEFSGGKASLEGLKEEVAKRVEDRVQEAKDTPRYEFWKFKKRLEEEQDNALKKVLEEKKGLLSKLFGG